MIFLILKSIIFIKVIIKKALINLGINVKSFKASLFFELKKILSRGKISLSFASNYTLIFKNENKRIFIAIKFIIRLDRLNPFIFRKKLSNKVLGLILVIIPLIILI